MPNPLASPKTSDRDALQEANSKYEPLLDYGADLTSTTLDAALGKLKYDNVLIHVHPSCFGTALELARTIGAAVKTEPSLTVVDEWWVEWQGRKVGSKGA